MNQIYQKNLKELILNTIAEVPDQYLCQLLTDTYGRYEYHLSVAQKNHVFFRNTHYFLSFSIPIYSAFITFIVSSDLVQSHSILGVIGFFLTILTIVASILKPYERCISAGNILITLSDWKTDLMINLGNFQPELDDTRNTSLYELLKRKDQEMSQIGESMMENLILKSSVNVREYAEK